MLKIRVQPELTPTRTMQGTLTSPYPLPQKLHQHPRVRRKIQNYRVAICTLDYLEIS